MYTPPPKAPLHVIVTDDFFFVLCLVEDDTRDTTAVVLYNILYTPVGHTRKCISPKEQNTDDKIDDYSDIFATRSVSPKELNTDKW